MNSMIFKNNNNKNNNLLIQMKKIKLTNQQQ